MRAVLCTFLHPCTRHHVTYTSIFKACKSMSSIIHDCFGESSDFRDYIVTTALAQVSITLDNSCSDSVNVLVSLLWGASQSTSYDIVKECAPNLFPKQGGCCRRQRSPSYEFRDLLCDEPYTSTADQCGNDVARKTCRMHPADVGQMSRTLSAHMNMPIKTARFNVRHQDYVRAAP